MTGIICICVGALLADLTYVFRVRPAMDEREIARETGRLYENGT